MDTKSQAVNNHSFMAHIHALRAFRREESIAVSVDGFADSIIQDYRFYLILDGNTPMVKLQSLLASFYECPYYNQQDAEAAARKLNQLEPTKKYTAAGFYFSLDDAETANFVRFFDAVDVNLLPSPNVKRWLIHHRQSFQARAAKNVMVSNFCDYDNPIENDAEFLSRCKLRESDEYTFDLHYYSVQVEHYEVNTSGIGSAKFFYLKDAIEHKKYLQSKYPDCRFAIDAGGFRSIGIDVAKYLSEPELNPFIRTWKEQQLQRVLNNRSKNIIINRDDPMIHTRVLQAHGCHYWRNFYIGSIDGTLTWPDIFISEERANEALVNYSKAYPDYEICVFERKTHTSFLRGFNTPLEEISCGYTREYYRIYRELMAVNSLLLKSGIGPIEISTFLESLPLFEAHYANESMNDDQRLEKLAAWHKTGLKKAAGDSHA